MAGQSYVQGSGPRGDDGDDADAGAVGGQAQVDVSGVDDLLDEIDGVLESNAETFVRSFVQKGGQ